MIQTKELQAIVKFMNAYGKRRGPFRVDLNGVKYCDFSGGMGNDIVIPEDSLRKLYSSILRSNELAKQQLVEATLQSDLWTECLDEPLWESYVEEVKAARKFDAGTEMKED